MGVISLDLQQTDAGANKWSYNWLTDLPSINGVTIQGDLTLEDLDIIIPTLVSELENDVGYITEEELGDRFYTKDEVYNKDETYNKSEVDSIFDDYYTSSEVDTKISDESTARANADNALSGRIDTNAANINSLAGDVAANSRAISDEAAARQNADTALSGRIDTNAANIATNTTNIATNTANIATNTADIATNTSAIATNTANIATNTANIATNASDIAGETDAREIADQGLQEQIDALAASSDVVDIVGTYAALQAYDTSKLHDNDIIKVLDDETRNDATTYYRWSTTTSTWSYIGAEGPFYTKADADATFVPQTRTINSKPLSSNVTLTAQDVGALPDSTVIPTVNNATLTIQKNGSTVETFTANSSTNKTANITVPTKTSDLTNDGDGNSNFATETYVDTYGGKIDTIKVNGTAQTITNKTVDLTVPTKTSDLTNDSNFAVDANYVHTDNNFTTALKDKLDGVASGAEVNQNAFSNVKVGSTTVSADSKTDTLELVAGSNVTLTPDATNDKVTIAATDTKYNDMTGATSSAAGAHGLVPAPAAGDNTKFLSGDGTWKTVSQYELPIASANTLGGVKIGENLSITSTGILSADAQQIDVDSALSTTSENPVQNKVITTELNKKANSSSLATVATSGSYNDLSNRPTIDSALSTSSTNAVQNKVVTTALNSKADTSSLATVATSGSYNDLSNKPTIPTVNNATLTIQKNGTTVKTFTANASSNVTANITVPTATSELTNDSGFIDEIPVASAGTLGGIKVGTNLSIDASGVLSATTSGSITKASGGTLGTTTINSTTANYMEVTKLSTATDLNTIKTTGVYIIAATPTNSPTGAWGTMYVDWTTGMKYQVYINDGVSGDIFKRSWDSSNSTWTSWVRITSADIANIERYYRSLVPVGTAITTDGVDLNTITYLKVGKYYCISDAHTKTLVNCPTREAFMMEVFSPLSTTIDNESTSSWVYRVRILTTYTGKMYIQKANSGSTAGTFGYGAWEEFAYTSGVDAKPNSYWGTCSTAAATAAKVVTVSSAQNFKLVPGAMVTFKAPNTNTAQNPTINVNGTGAKPVWYNSAVVSTGNLDKAGQINRPATYVYDGTNWVWVSWSLDDNTTYSTMSVSEGTTGTATTARTVRADYLKQIIEHYQPTVNDATLTIQKNGTNVQTFTANSSSNKVANIQVPNLQTSDTDPGEGSALAADTFLGIYDIAPEDVDGSRLINNTVTWAKIAQATMPKAKIALLSATNGSFDATDKGVLIVNEQFQNNAANTSCTAQIAFTGASGTTVTPRASQRSSTPYTRSHVFGIALVDAGDSVTWTVNYSNTGLPDWGADGGFSLFIPFNW